MLRQRSGAIINLSSIVAAMGNPGQANYVATKAGIEGLTNQVHVNLLHVVLLLMQLRLGLSSQI